MRVHHSFLSGGAALGCAALLAGSREGDAFAADTVAVLNP